MHKTWLVALREFIENVRTKTFWIGILSVPVLLVGIGVIMRVMHAAKDARPYGVADYSAGQWLSKAVEDRANSSDLELVLRELAELKDLGKGRDEVLAHVRERRDRLSSPLQREALDVVLAALEEIEPGALADLDAAAAELGERFMRWYMSKSPSEQAQLEVSLARDRYPRVQTAASDPAAAEAELKDKLQRGEIFAYFVIGADPVQSDAGSRYVSNNLTDDALRDWYAAQATEVVRDRRIAEFRIAPEHAEKIRSEFDFSEQKVSTETGEVEEVKAEQKAHQFAPVVFVYMLWIAIMMATQMLLTNTVEEKSNRIIEVLLSSVSPLQLMAGKIFGIGATGLTLVLFWFLCGAIGITLLPVFVPQSGNLGLKMIIGDPRYLGSFVGYFLGGYFFFAAILVGIGAVCNSLKEAQNLQQPVFILLIVPLAAMVPVVNDPNGTLAKVLTYVPPFTPFLMMNRAAGPPAAVEYAVTTVLIAVSIAVAFWGAAKVFRIGILMTGKPPKLREIWGWMRAPS